MAHRHEQGCSTSAGAGLGAGWSCGGPFGRRWGPWCAARGSGQGQSDIAALWSSAAAAPTCSTAGPPRWCGIAFGLCQGITFRHVHPSCWSANATRHGMPSRFFGFAHGWPGRSTGRTSLAGRAAWGRPRSGPGCRDRNSRVADVQPSVPSSARTRRTSANTCAGAPRRRLGCPPGRSVPRCRSHAGRNTAGW